MTGQAAPDYHATAAAVKFETRAFINGAYVKSQTGKTFETVNPATGKTLAAVAECYSEGDFTVPFGGYKESGFGGKDKSLMAHEQYTETKTI